MSLTRLGANATRRRLGVQNEGPALAAAAPVGVQADTKPPNSKSKTENTVQRLVEYFPTETVTLFMAAISAQKSFDHIPFVAGISPFWMIVAFTVLTPLMLLTAAYATHREIVNSNKALSNQKFDWPIFDLIAAAFAFVPWALSVPGLFPDTSAQKSGVERRRGSDGGRLARLPGVLDPVPVPANHRHNLTRHWRQR